MTTQNTAKYAGRSDEPIALVDQIRQLYSDQLSLLESKEKANLDVTSPLPAWLRSAMSQANKERVSLDSAPGLSDGDELIQLSPFTSTKDARVAQDVARLMDVLSDDPSVCIASMGKMHLAFTGFPPEQPESWEEVARQHFQKVNRQWPYWLHFLAPTFKNYANLTALLCDLLTHKKVAGRNQVLLNRDDLYANLKRLVMASLNLQEIWCVSMERRWHHSHQVVDMLRQCVKRG